MHLLPSGLLHRHDAALPGPDTAPLEHLDLQPERRGPHAQTQRGGRGLVRGTRGTEQDAGTGASLGRQLQSAQLRCAHRPRPCQNCPAGTRLERLLSGPQALPGRHVLDQQQLFDPNDPSRVPDGAKVNFAAVMERMRRLRASISPNDSAARFRDLGVDVFLGEGRFRGLRPRRSRPVALRQQR